MLSTRFYKVIGTLVDFGKWCGSFNFLYDRERKILVLSKDISKIQHVKRNLYLIGLWGFAALGIIIRNCICGEPNEITLNSLYLAVVIFFSLVLAIIQGHTKSVVIFTNGLIDLSGYLKDEFMHYFFPDTDMINFLLDGVLVVLSSSCFGFGILGFLYALYDPRGCVFLGQLIPLRVYSYFPFGFGIALFHGYLLLVFFIANVCIVTVATTYLVILVVILTKEFEVGKFCKYRTISEFRRPENLQKCYRAFQVLHENLLSFIGPYITRFYFFLTVTPVFIHMIVFKHWHELNVYLKAAILLGYFAASGFWMFALQMGKYLWIRQTKIFRSWSKHGWKENVLTRKAMKKFQKSCKPILLQDGNTLVIGRMTQFHYIKTVIVLTLKALITFY